MISINKCLVLAVVASVLLSAAFVQADDSSEEATSEKPRIIGGLGTKIYNGIKTAGSAIMSHLKPYLGQPAAKDASEATSPANKDEAAPEAEAKNDEEETSGEAEQASDEKPASEDSSEEQTTEGASEEPATEESATEAAAEESDDKAETTTESS